jgi:hypothetical protein
MAAFRALVTKSRPSLTGQFRKGFRLSICLTIAAFMTKRPTIAERVAGLVRRMDGTPLCDECIADRLDLSSIAQASVVTSSASGTGGFERLRGPCGLCGEPGPVIRYNG